MYKYFKKLAQESSLRSNSKSQNSPLHEEYGNNVTLRKCIKNNLRNCIFDEFLNDAVITYFENDSFESVSIDNILHRFQNIKLHRG